MDVYGWMLVITIVAVFVGLFSIGVALCKPGK
jgi:hypothetical protein